MHTKFYCMLKFSYRIAGYQLISENIKQTYIVPTFHTHWHLSTKYPKYFPFGFGDVNLLLYTLKSLYLKFVYFFKAQPIFLSILI